MVQEVEVEVQEDMGKSLGVDDARFPRPISRGCRGARDMTALLMLFVLFMHICTYFGCLFKTSICDRI